MRLRGIEIVEERPLAGLLAGVLYMTAAVTVPLTLLLPGGETQHWKVVVVVAAIAAVWGTLCFVAVPWETVSPLVSHFSSALGFPLTALAVALTGGADSPASYYLLFVVVYVSAFYRWQEAVPYLIACVVVHALPLTYDPSSVADGLPGQLLVAGPTYLVLGGLILSGKRLIVGLRDHSRRLALEDNLTGLPNRRALIDRLELHVGGQRDTDALGFLLVDIDHFKDVNTRFGHPGGDRVLRATARALEGAMRDGDMTARLGGDEFAILARACDEDGMERLARRVLAAVGHLDGPDLLDHRLSVSVGWARYPEDAASVDELLAAADLCMRIAKVGGRGRSQSPHDLVPEHLEARA